MSFTIRGSSWDIIDVHFGTGADQDRGDEQKRWPNFKMEKSPEKGTKNEERRSLSISHEHHFK